MRLPRIFRRQWWKTVFRGGRRFKRVTPAGEPAKPLPAAPPAPEAMDPATESALENFRARRDARGRGLFSPPRPEPWGGSKGVPTTTVSRDTPGPAPRNRTLSEIPEDPRETALAEYFEKRRLAELRRKKGPGGKP